MMVPLIIRVILSVFISKTRKKYANAAQQESYYDNGHSMKKEGEVFVSTTKTERDKVVEKDMGEYVDFETVKED